jgi:Holliday junction resolvase
MFFECLDTKAVIQRIETTTSNGVPDILAILPNKVLLIESKFETKKLRPEQAAFQIKSNVVLKDSVNKCITLSAYPKSKRFIMMMFDASSIGKEGIEENGKEVIFSLDKKGFTDFINYTKTWTN